MRHPAALALAAILLASAASLSAQSATDSTSPDSTPHKHGGLFGKAKSFVGNKTVRAVAKTVACTMVPGGQVIAGALDAASSRSAEAAAAGAASGGGCMPGGMAAAGLGATGMRGAAMAGGVGGVAGTVAGATELAAMARLGAGRGAAPSATMPAMGYGAAPVGMNEEDFANCLGLTAAEFRDFADPTHGAARQPTKKELDRQAKLSRKVDMPHYQQCVMAQASVAQPPAPAQAAAGPTSGTAVEEPEAIAVSADPVGELRKGRTTLRGIGWQPGGSELAEGGADAFGNAMTRLAMAVRQAGGTYRLDIYLEPRVDKASAAVIGAARLAAVEEALDHAGLPTGLVTSGKTKVDKDDRLEFVRTKK